MKKIIILILLYMTFSVLYANENIFTSPKVALKMINKKDVLFVVLGDASLEIKKSKKLNIDFLTSSGTLGYLSCSPFYRCPKEMERYFSHLGIEKDQPLVIYDNTYGINAATLYTILESMGHKNMTILRGGVKDIIGLDPNWKIYDKYLQELEGFVSLIQKDTNESFINEYASKINGLKKKIKVLKPHLLVGKSNIIDNENKDTNYSVTNANKEYFLSKKDLIRVLNEISNEEANMSIIDICDMPDIFGKPNLKRIKSLSWKVLIDKKKKQLKSNEELKELFAKLGLDKMDDNYVYCMSGAQKAFFAMMALREVGYTKVKVFTGDWNTWIGDIYE